MKAIYVTDRASLSEGRFEEVLDALRGSPDLAVQLREKEIADGAYLKLAVRCREILRSTPLLVNGRFDVALAAGAAGVHLPESGLPLSRVRPHTPRGFRLGVSTHSAGGAARLIEEGADVVFVGPIFQTPSKTGRPLGPSALGELPPQASHTSDVYAIGGITEQNLEELAPYRDRIAGIAAIRLFQESDDPRGSAKRIALR